MAVATIERVTSEFAGYLETVKPGEPFRVSNAVTPTDKFRVDQGDLLMAIVDGPPEGYVRVNRPKAADRQLVPGNTKGAKHCLDSLKGVKLFRQVGWTDESLRGPYFECSEERTVRHPVHGDVTFPAGTKVLCGYQREFDAEQRRERRARD